MTWAEELAESARAVHHPRLASLCAIAALCYMFGRADDAIRYSDIGVLALRQGSQELPFGLEQVWLGAVYSSIDEPEQHVAFCREQMTTGDDRIQIGRASTVMALVLARRAEEALAVSSGLVEAAEATHNPFAISYALLNCGMVQSLVDPVRALDPLRRGLVIAQHSGNRANVAYVALTLALTLPSHTYVRYWGSIPTHS